MSILKFEEVEQLYFEKEIIAKVKTEKMLMFL
jgi:hypothetical protein